MRVAITAILVSSCAAGALARAATLTTLYAFAGGTDGRRAGGVVLGRGGVLYGTTAYGGDGGCTGLGCGTVFLLSPPSSGSGAWNKTVLYSFRGGGDGWYPVSGLAIDSNGILYGATTPVGGPGGGGTIFSLTPPSSSGGVWTKSTLYTFQGGSDGWDPAEPLAISSNGVLYGVTGSGGPSGFGTVFSLAPPASPGATWTETTLHDFAYGTSDGNYPLGVVLGNGGALYGITQAGGASNTGVVFALSPPSQGSGIWTEAILYAFSTGGTSGYLPFANLIIGQNGALYGTTVSGGNANGGTVYSLTPPAASGGAWAYHLLYSFPVVNSYSPYPGLLVAAESGALFGVTSDGGPAHAGTVFVLTPPASGPGSWTQHLLSRFNYSDGAFPVGLVMSGNGVLYGATSGGGPSYSGTVFALTF